MVRTQLDPLIPDLYGQQPPRDQRPANSVFTANDNPIALNPIVVVNGVSSAESRACVMRKS